MLACENLVDRRSAPLLDLVRERQAVDLCSCMAVGRSRALIAVDCEVAQQGVNDSAQRRDLHGDLGRGVRAFHRHFVGSFVRLAMTKVAAWAGRASNGGVPLASARSPGMAALPLLALTTCSDLRENAARDVLRDAGYERIVVSPESWLNGPCKWTERYAVRFVGTKDGQRWDGVMCATGEAVQGARIVAVAVIRPAPDWQSFHRSGR